MEGKMAQNKKQSQSEEQLQESPVASKTVKETTQKTPTRGPGRIGKRKLQPMIPALQSKDDLPSIEKPPVVKKRRRSSSTSGMASPTSMFKPALTERQQLALLLQMTDPQKQSPGGSTAASIESSPRDTPVKGRIHRRNERGETPLHLACIRGDESAVLSLIEQGADVNATDNAGWSPLHEACNHGHIKIAAILLDNEAFVNALGMDGDTPLHDAVSNSHIEVVGLLMEKGADITIVNAKEKTPLDLCREEGIRALLLKSVKHDQDVRRTENGQDEEKEVFAEDKVVTKKEINVEPSSCPHIIIQTPPSQTLARFPRQKQGRRAETPPARLHAYYSRGRGQKKKPNSRGSFYSDVSSSESEADHLETEISHLRPHPPKIIKLTSISEADDSLTESPVPEKTNMSVILTEEAEQKECNMVVDVKIDVTTIQPSLELDDKDIVITPDLGQVSSSSVLDQRDLDDRNNGKIEDTIKDGDENTCKSEEVLLTNGERVEDNTQDLSETVSMETTNSDAKDVRSPLILSEVQEVVSSLVVSIMLNEITLKIGNISNDTLKDPTSKQTDLQETSEPTESSLLTRNGSEDVTSPNIDSSSPVTRSVSVVSGAVRRVSSIDDESTCSEFPELPLTFQEILIQRESNVLVDDDDNDSCSTVVSFSTSLPLVFGSRTPSRSQSPSRSLSPPPLTTPLLSGLVTSSLRSKVDTGEPLECAKDQGHGLKKSPPTHNDNSASKGDQDAIKRPDPTLPTKKRILREVYKSEIINHRRNLPSHPPQYPPHNYDTYLLSTRQYQSGSLPKPTNAETIYPPIPPSFIKLFTEQENERLNLLASHLTEVDRLVICFEQELLRAQERANSSTFYPPLSVCSVLMERQFPLNQSFFPQENSDSKVSRDSDRKDERLLAGYVRDVWDKYHRESVLLASRHKMEVETLWLTQTHHWIKKQKETGTFSSPTDIPASHVPVTHSGTFPSYVH